MPATDDAVERLSPEDRSILALENDTVAGHACKVVMLRRELDVQALRGSIAARLHRAPRLSVRLQEVDGEPCWVPDPRLEIRAHVTTREDAGGCDEAALRSEVARLFEQRLDRSRPLWRIDVIPRLAGGGSALVWRIHHALADGSTALRIADAVLWDDDQDAAGARSRPPGSGPAGAAPGHGLGRVRVAAREAPQPWRRSPFDGHIGARRTVAFAGAELEGLRRVARATDGATVNDAVLAVVAGGLRRWLEARHGHLGAVRVKVPVSLHEPAPAGDGADPGNRDSFFCLELPVDLADPVERLDAIRRATRVRKEGHDAEQLDTLMRELARIPPLRRFAERALAHSRSFALNVSNIRGPRQAVHVLGVPVDELYSLAEIREHHALRVAVVSLAGRLYFGLSADPTLVDDVHELAGEMQAEADALAAAG
jgi:hypothetical protein